MQVVTSQGVQDLPRVGSWWRHKKNKNFYRVIAVSNLSDRQEEYPVTITYEGPNRKCWSKQAFNWFEKMEPISVVIQETLYKQKGQGLTVAEQTAELCQLFEGMFHELKDKVEK